LFLSGTVAGSDIFFLVCIRKTFVQILLHRWRQRQNIMVQQFSSFIPSIGSHGLGLVARFVAKNLHLLVQLVVVLRMRYHNYYCSFSYYLPTDKPGPRCLYCFSILDLGCPVIEVSSF
jgi:hypothetical protein